MAVAVFGACIAGGPGTSQPAPSVAPEELQGVHFSPASPTPPGTGHWLADYHLIRERVKREVGELVAETGANFLDVMVIIPTTLREKATAPSDAARGVADWANMTTLDNLVAFLDDCHQLGVSVEVDLACNLWVPYRVDTENHIGQSEWWPEPDDTPWTEAAVWYEQIIRHVEGSVAAPESIAFWTLMGNHQLGGAEPVTWDWPERAEIATCTERFVKAVWPRFCRAAERPVGSPIMLPILADTPYWNAKSAEARLSSFRNLKQWLVDDLEMPPDYWVMSTYPCCDPATDGVEYLREIVRILGRENASRIISTDFKGAGHEIAPSIVDKSHLSDADVLRWHFAKVSEHGFGGWWIWSYQDSPQLATGLRDQKGRWKPELVSVVRERTSADESGYVKVGDQTYRDVISTCFQRPFLTDADMQIYFTDTRGRVATDGSPAMFSCPGIQQVLVNGEPLPVVRRGENLVQVRVASGVHDVEIIASEDDAVLELPNGFERGIQPVSDVETFNARAEALRPGDELVVENGVYTGWATALVEGKGVAGKPVVIRPETPGGVIFRGRTHFRLTGKHILFKGFRFDHAGPAHVLYMIEGEHIRVTQCQFTSCGDSGRTFSHIVRITRNCHRSRIDHCYFTASKCISIGLRLFGIEDLPRDNRIDHNIFRDIFRYWGNGQENIQIGGPSECTAAEATVRTLVEYCLFDNAWGDSETISNKSSENTIRYNVAANCLFSAFTIRSGNNVRFEGNVMVNSGGGVRVFGEQHVIVNNLFLNLLDSGLTLQTGTEYVRLPTAETGTLIANNTFVDCPVGTIGAERASPAYPAGVKGVSVVNNLMTSNQGQLIDLSAAEDVDIRSNLMWLTGHAEAGQQGSDALLADPQLEGTGVAIQPAASSPAIDAAEPLEEVTLDRWGRRRPAGQAPDIGADEIGAGERPFDMLPEIPAPPLLMPGLHKGDYAFGVGDEPETRLTNESLEAPYPLPGDFIMEWEYLPKQWESEASVTFSAGDGGGGYTISWGGVDDDGRPLGVIALRKGAEFVADGADIVHHRMTYHVSRMPERPETPAEKWYRFVLIRRGGKIWLAHAGRTESTVVPVVPVIIWQDRATPDSGPDLTIAQTGEGIWRNMHVWRHEHGAGATPPAPVALTGESKGPSRVALRWRHGEQGRVNCTYDVHRGTEADFQPTEANRIAGPVAGAGYDDFHPPTGKVLHYGVRSRNVLGRTSRLAGVTVPPAKGGSIYLYLAAGSAEEVQSPLALEREGGDGPELLVVPPNAGSPTTGPVEAGLARYGFDAPEAGGYALWALARGPDGSSDSFYFSLDSEALASYASWGTGVQDTWMWRPVWQKELTAGQHSVRIKHRETGPLLKALLVTDDLSFSPPPPQ